VKRAAARTEVHLLRDLSNIVTPAWTETAATTDAVVAEIAVIARSNRDPTPLLATTLFNPQ
jgi:hypothetical protein